MSDESVLKAEVKKSNGTVKLAAILIAGGVVLLAANLLHISLMAFIWPMFIIGAGVLMVWPAYKSTADDQSKLSFLAIPGYATVVTGVLLLLMNLVNHFESWAYTWPLLLAGGAYGYAYMHRFDEDGKAEEGAHKFIRVMVLTFMGLAALFELLIFQSLGAWWPLLIVGLGIYLYVRNKRSVA